MPTKRHDHTHAEDIWNEKLRQEAADEQQAREAAEAQVQADKEAAEVARVEKEKAEVCLPTSHCRFIGSVCARGQVYMKWGEMEQTNKYTSDSLVDHGNQ